MIRIEKGYLKEYDFELITYSKEMVVDGIKAIFSTSNCHDKVLTVPLRVIYLDGFEQAKIDFLSEVDAL